MQLNNTLISLCYTKVSICIKALLLYALKGCIATSIINVCRFSLRFATYAAMG
jgi:hypothetical protein